MKILHNYVQMLILISKNSEKIYKLWAKLYKSKSKEDSLKALELSQAICSALPRLLNEIKQYRVNNE